MATQEKPWISGWVLVLLFYFFFPVSIVLLIVRMIKHRKHTHLKILDRKLLGHFFLSIFLVMASIFLFMPVSSPESDAPSLLIAVVFLALLFLTPALAFYRKANKMKQQMLARFDQYYAMVYHDKLTSIAHMAEIVKMPLETVVNELQHMISTYKLPGAAINPYTNQIMPERSEDTEESKEPHEDVLEDIVEGVNTLIQDMTRSKFPAQTIATGLGLAGGTLFNFGQPAEAAKPKTVECPSCGAKTVLQPGDSKECEYCTTALHYNMA